MIIVNNKSVIKMKVFGAAFLSGKHINLEYLNFEGVSFKRTLDFASKEEAEYCYNRFLDTLVGTVVAPMYRPPMHEPSNVNTLYDFDKYRNQFKDERFNIPTG